MNDRISAIVADSLEVKRRFFDVHAADVHAIVLAALTAQRQGADPARPGHLAALVLDCLRPN